LLRKKRIDDLLKAAAHCLLLEASPLRKQRNDTLSVGVPDGVNNPASLHE
jgi:hypothetical protein